MNFKSNQEGFIFTLDATLALLVALIALTSVARIGTPSSGYDRWEDLQVERYGKDAVRSLRLNGTLEETVSEIEKTNYGVARKMIRDNLREMLPKNIQFRVSIGGAVENIYPTADPGWDDVFDNLDEKIVSTQFQPIPPEENSWKVLSWTPRSKDRDFVENLSKMKPYWLFKNVDDEDTFRSQIQADSYENFDAVFVPTAGQFVEDTITELNSFSEHGRLVMGGRALFRNQDGETGYNINFRGDSFGITDVIDRRQDDYDTGESYLDGAFGSTIHLNDMYGWHTDHDFNHPVIRPFVISQRFVYDGDNIYVYGGSVGTDPGVASGYDSNFGTVLTSWGDDTESGRLIRNGVIAYDDSNGDGVGIYLNMNFVQCSLTNGTDPYDWHLLAIRSLGGGQFESQFRPVSLSVWRGERLN